MVRQAPVICVMAPHGQCYGLPIDVGGIIPTAIKREYRKRFFCI